MTIKPLELSPRPPVNALFDFRGQTVLVTGARKGLGQGIAERFAEAGANVVVHTRRPDEATDTLRLVLDQGVRAAVAVSDLGDEKALSEALTTAENEVGPITILVNNAGAYPVEPFDALSPQGFEATVHANLSTAFRATKVCAERWRTQERPGWVVNVSSIESTRPAVGHSHYSSAKAALDMLTRATALELAPSIRVNAVAPGLIHYPELTELWPEGVERYRARAPLGREGHRQEVADVCLFLCSPASSWMTGSVVVVDGGVSVAPHF